MLITLEDVEQLGTLVDAVVEEEDLEQRLEQLVLVVTPPVFDRSIILQFLFDSSNKGVIINWL